jgi:hypothetical protein
MTERPHVRPDEVREREHWVEIGRFHRAHIIELTYFSLLGAVALGVISFLVADPQWAWFLRGMIAGLVLTFAYALARMMQSRL